MHFVYFLYLSILFLVFSFLIYSPFHIIKNRSSPACFFLIFSVLFFRIFFSNLFFYFFYFIFSIFFFYFFLCMHAYVYVRVFISRTSLSLICVTYLGCKAQDQRAQIPVAAIIPNNVLKSIAIIGSNMHIIQQSS